MYLKKQLSIIKTKLIITLGRMSTCTIMKSKDALKNLRNQFFKCQNIDFIETYHSYVLLCNPNFKKYDDVVVDFIKNNYLLKN